MLLVYWNTWSKALIGDGFRLVFVLSLLPFFFPYRIGRRSCFFTSFFAIFGFCFIILVPKVLNDNDMTA